MEYSGPINGRVAGALAEAAFQRLPVPPAPPPIPAEGLPPGFPWAKLALWTFRGFGISAGLVLLVVIVLPIALPRRPSDEAKSSEARAMLGAMKDRARVVYQRTGKSPATFLELGMSDVELNGSYFNASNYRITNAKPECWTASCSGVYSAAPQELVVTADLAKGSHSFNR
jgi:hypothetical protein